jgi:hypothetical protein
LTLPNNCGSEVIVVVTHKIIFSGETFDCPVCNCTYVWNWDRKANAFSFRCVSGKPCKHISFKFNHHGGFDPDFPETLIVRFVDWDRIRYLVAAGAFYILAGLWFLAFAYFLPAEQALLVTWPGIVALGTGAGFFVRKAQEKK